jgi:hypothetical protein
MAFRIRICSKGAGPRRGIWRRWEGQRFDSAAKLRKTRQRPKEEFKREAGGARTGREPSCGRSCQVCPPSRCGNDDWAVCVGMWRTCCPTLPDDYGVLSIWPKTKLALIVR